MVETRWSLVEARSEGVEMTESWVETRNKADEMGWKRDENQLETDERRESLMITQHGMEKKKGSLVENRREAADR